MHGRARRCKAKQGRHGKTALTCESYLYSSTDFAPRTRGVRDLFGSTHLEVISPVPHESSLLAELMSASPVLQSFSINLAAVKVSAANRNCPSFSLSQPRGPLQSVTGFMSTHFHVPQTPGATVFRPAWTATIVVPPGPRVSQ